MLLITFINSITFVDMIMVSFFFSAIKGIAFLFFLICVSSFEITTIILVYLKISIKLFLIYIHHVFLFEDNNDKLCLSIHLLSAYIHKSIKLASTKKIMYNHLIGNWRWFLLCKAFIISKTFFVFYFFQFLFYFFFLII